MKLEDLKDIKQYFLKNDKTIFEYKAYKIMDGLINELENNQAELITVKPFTYDFANVLLTNALRQLTLDQRHKLTMDLIERDNFIKKVILK